MSQQFSLVNLFDGPPVQTPLTGKDLRDSGMESVLANTSDEWKAKFRGAIESLNQGTKFTIERITDSIGPRPIETHYNVIGALTFALAKKGVIGRTGETFKAERASLRHTDVPEWI